MSAETAALAVTPHPLGKPGGPGLFGDRSLSLPPYVQNIAHTLMTKRGMDKSKAIQVALGTVKNWASGQGNVRPEVRAAASAALADWEKSKAKAHATPNKTELSNSSDETQVVELSALDLLREFASLDGNTAVELAREPEPHGQPTPPKKAKRAKKDQPQGKHKLPPGAVGWKHNWVPVDKNGNPVGPSQKDKSASEISDMAGHTEATKDAIRQAYKNKAVADGKKAATKAKSTARHAAAEAKHAATLAKRKARQQAAAAKKAKHAKEMAAKKAATAKARAKKEAERKATAKTKARQKLVSDATKQALADKKAGRPLTPTQVKLLDAYDSQQAATKDNLRNNVSLSQPMAPTGQVTVPTVSSQDGGRMTASTLMTKYPKNRLKRAILKKRKDRA